jgi:hypothetical protein
MIPGLNQLTQRRVSELIRELDLSGIINARTISKGKYGRTKFIRMNITSEDAYKYLKSDHKLAELLDYRPRAELRRCRGEPSFQEISMGLSRTPEMEESVYRGILERLEKQGYDTGRLMRTPQPGGKN